MPNTPTDMPHDPWECDCDECWWRQQDAIDKWESEAQEREQKRREELEALGYYDE